MYILQNTTNNKVYVGFTSNPAARWKSEKSDALNVRSKYYRTPLSAAIRRDGWESFTKAVIEEFDSKHAALEAEAFWIEFFRSNRYVFGPDGGYNRSAGGEQPPSWQGKKHSPATIAKMRAAKLGNRHSVGRKHPPEVLEKMRRTKLGKVASLETRIKMSESQRRWRRVNAS